MKKILLITSALLACCCVSAQQEKKISIQSSSQPAMNASVKTEALPAKNGGATVQDIPEPAEASYTLSASSTLDPNLTPTVVPVIYNPKAAPQKNSAEPANSNPKNRKE